MRRDLGFLICRSNVANASFWGTANFAVIRGSIFVANNAELRVTSALQAPLAVADPNVGDAVPEELLFIRHQRRILIMPRKPTSHRDPWSASDLKTLKKFAKQKKSQRAVAKALGRTPAAVQQKAFAEGVAFRSRKRGSRRKK
jgi:hypothetical protein